MIYKYFLILLGFPMLCSSQYIDNLTYGVKFGGLHSRITNLPEMLDGREHYRVLYDLNSKATIGVEGGFFLNYKIPDTRTAIQGELFYRNSGAKVLYSNSRDENYELKLNYSYLVLGAVYKLYPILGFNFGIGAHYSKNLSPSSLEYKSNVSGGLYDTTNRQFYREGIIGKDDFNLSFSLGYELNQGLHFDLRYYLGVGDMIGNRATSFQFVENINRNSLLSVSVGYSFVGW